ncbi:MAG: hypothetical protein PHR53_03845 [Bacteroidales bacterium]|nr:hypothetical protein [Bacteroidales bacterium]
MESWLIFAIEAVVLLLFFTAVILIPLAKNPVWWIHDYPKDIQEEYFKTHERVPTQMLSATVLIKKGFAVVFALILLYFLAKWAGAYDFTSGFAVSYALWSVINWYDCFILDWIVFARWKKIRLPGTEQMNQAYHQKKYHFIRALYGAVLGLLPSVIIGVIFSFYH